MERSSSQEMEGEEYHRGDSFDNGKRRSQSDMRNHQNNISYDEYQHHPQAVPPRTLAPISQKPVKRIIRDPRDHQKQTTSPKKEEDSPL
jgi:UDP-N-acetylmuramate-alanine ligase